MKFLQSVDFFLQINLSKILSRIPVSMSNRGQMFIGPDLDPNCLQRLSADQNSRESLLRPLLTGHVHHITSNRIVLQIKDALVHNKMNWNYFQICTLLQAELESCAKVDSLRPLGSLCGSVICEELHP